MTVKKLLKKDYLVGDVEDSLSEAIGKLQDEISEIVVFKGKTLAGIFSPAALKTSRIDIAQAKVRSYLINVTIVEDEDEKRVLELMYNSGINTLPIGENGKVEGVVNVFDILKILLENQTVKSALSESQPFVSEDDRVGKAIEIMNEESIDTIPVLENNEITGFITRFDLMKNYYIHHHKRDYGGRGLTGKKTFETPEDILALPVKTFVRGKQIYYVEAKTTLLKCVELMEEKGVLELAVDKTFITLRDIVKTVLMPATTRRDIEIVGINELDSTQQSGIEKISAHHYDKVNYFVTNPKIRLHIKVYKNIGKKRKYSIKINMQSSEGNFAVDQAHDWELNNAIHKGFTDLENNLRKKFRK